MDIFFYEAFEEEAKVLKMLLEGQVQADFSWKTIQECDHLSPPAPLISIRTQSKIPLHWKSQLGGILSRSTGYDHLTRLLSSIGQDMPCGYLPLYCHRAVAEQAMLLWMALLRHLPAQMDNVSTFCRDGLTGKECSGKTLFVAGVGHIGYEISRIGRGLGMHVLGYDIVQKYDDVTYISLQEGLKMADIVVCAMNLTEDNKGFFNAGVLKQTRPGVLFVNVARGELSSTEDLLELLDSGHLAGVGMDVYEHESEIAVAWREGRSTPRSDLLKKIADHPRSICTPHNAFNSSEAVARKSEHSVRQITHFLTTGRWLWPVPSQIE